MKSKKKPVKADEVVLTPGKAAEKRIWVTPDIQEMISIFGGTYHGNETQLYILGGGTSTFGSIS